MRSNRFVTLGLRLGLCLGLCLALAAALTPAAEAQNLAGYNCLQNLSNGQFKTSSASQLANACQSQQIWQLTQVSGKTSYCIKN